MGTISIGGRKRALRGLNSVFSKLLVCFLLFGLAFLFLLSDRYGCADYVPENALYKLKLLIGSIAY